MKAETLDVFTQLSEAEEAQVLAFMQGLINPKNTQPNGHPQEVGQSIFYYDTTQSYFSSEDITAIVKKFPEDRKWVFADLQNEYIFPPEHFVKIEIIDYTLYIMPNPSYQHQRIPNLVSAHITMYVSENTLGEVTVAPVSVKIDEGNVVEPDILFISIKKMQENPNMVQKQFVEGSPDLVVEVISPANHKKLREEKKERYEKAGVEEYWEIYPEKEKVIVETLEEVENKQGIKTKQYKVYSKAEKVGEIQSKILEGFSLDLKSVFA